MPELTDFLKDLRSRHGTQEEVGKKIGYKSQQISQYEKGARKPKMKFYRKWKEVFGEDLEAMMSETNVSRGTENHTSVDIPSDNKEKNLRVPEEIYRDLVEANSEYRLVPKTILEGKYVIVLESQVGKTEDALWVALRAKDDLINDLKQEIAHYRASRTATQKTK